jgi:uncharacterized sulfatase
MKIPALHQWIPAFNRFLLYSALLQVLIFFLRLVDMLGLRFTGKLQEIPGVMIYQALRTDLFTFFSIVRWVALPYLLLYMFISKRLANGLYLFLVCVYAITSLALIIYFQQTSVLLGADIYGYTAEDIKLTIGAAAGSFKPAFFALLLALLATITFLIVLFARRHIKGDRRGFWFVLICLFFFRVSVSQELTANHLGTEYTGNAALNKTGYFLTRTGQHFFPERRTADIADLTVPADYKYVGGDAYPFLREANTSNVLGPFLQVDSARKPNIVIILLEGLGRAFSGRGAYLGSFTPFIDSLAQHSLYWENGLSGGGRTFAVLPTVLGSLPFASSGYNEQGPDMPPALTLINISRYNGYRARFLYSGNAGFDKMDQFLQKQGVDSIIHEPNFGKGYEKLPSYAGFSWGYSDRALFRKYLESTPPDTSQPRLDVLLTVSTHSPFLIPGQAYYEQLATARMQQQSTDAARMSDFLQYRNVYASVMYMDDCLRGFFHAFAQRPDYQHTIFLITGDHRLPEIPMRSKIDRYHSPIIIYSPLLKRSATFSAISSHFDIGPSLLAYLQEYPGFSAPQLVTWLGKGLDTARDFRNLHHYPLMQTKNDLVDYVDGAWMVNSGKLFRILPNMDLEPVQNDTMQKRLMSGFNYYLNKNDQLVQRKQLIPDSLYQAYTK